MLYRRLGRTDLKVSELSFGAARGASADPQGFVTTVKAAIDAGVNFVDTAAGYENGESERVLAQALKGHDDVIVETKYLPYESFAPPAVYNGSAQKLVASAEGSLQRLRRERLDVLLGHGMRTMDSFERFMSDGSYDAMVKLRDQGKVRFIGISELSEADGTHEVLQHALPTGAFDVVMLTLNFLLQTAADSVLSLAKAHDVGTVIMMPLNQASKESGLVSVEAALECVRRHIAHGNLADADPYTDRGLFDFLRPYSVPEAALRYVLAHEVGTCCVGMRTPERVKDNLKALAPPYLDDGRLSTLRELFGAITWQVR